MRLKTRRLVGIVLLLVAGLFTFSWIPSPTKKSHASDSLLSHIGRRLGLSLKSGSFQTKNSKLITNIGDNGKVERTAWHLPAGEELLHVNKSDTVGEEPALFSNYFLGETRTVTLKDKTPDFFTSSGCLIVATQNWTGVKCRCKKGWHGEYCSIPDFVDETKFQNSSKLVTSSRPRRLIYGMPFNMEFEMLELRLGDAGDLIDAIIIVESNYTGYGKPKRLYLLEKLKQGFLKQHQHKIVYLCMHFFPTGKNPKDGRFTDFYTKNYPSKEGLQFIKDRRDDDIFIMSDADEIHRREALLFLKLHDNYPEPVGGIFRRNIFGFYWSSGFTKLGFACSLRMLSAVYGNKASELRGATSNEHYFLRALNNYTKQGHNAQMWQMGKVNSVSNIAGWHCSWCLTPDLIRIKLLSAYNYDLPRWGDYPEKTKLDYITDLIRVGLWFDDKSMYIPQYVTKHSPYAPHYAFQHATKFSHLLFNPFLDL